MVEAGVNAFRPGETLLGIPSVLPDGIILFILRKE